MADKLAPVASREAWRGRMIKVTVDSVQLPNGHTTDLEIVRHPGAAAVVPVDADGNVVLVKQMRYATGGFLLEVPAGKLDPGEAPEACAARELVEETGLRPGKLVSMGAIFTSPGFTDERIWLYVATDLQPAPQALEDDEVLTLERMPLREALEKALTGEIDDAKSVCALLRAPRFLYG
jgi:ADP-ribose pyrophosphatase